MMLTQDDALDLGMAVLDDLACRAEELADQLQVLRACMHSGRGPDREVTAAAAARLDDMSQLARRLLLFVPDTSATPPAAPSIVRESSTTWRPSLVNGVSLPGRA